MIWFKIHESIEDLHLEEPQAVFVVKSCDERKLLWPRTGDLQIRHFLDLPFTRADAADLLPQGVLQRIDISHRNTQDGLLPSYLYCFWLDKIKIKMEGWIAQSSNVGGPWQFQFALVNPHASLFDRELCGVKGCITHAPRDLYSRACGSNGGCVDVSITENHHLDRDPLGGVKRLHLRDSLFEQVDKLEIVLDRSIKKGKVYSVVQDGYGLFKRKYLVKFDFPRMVQREKRNYREVTEAIKRYGRNSRLRQALYTLDTKSSEREHIGCDILGIIKSEPSDGIEVAY